MLERPRAMICVSGIDMKTGPRVWKDRDGNYFTGKDGTIPITEARAAELLKPAKDPEQATVNAFFDTVDRYLWPCVISFVAGCYFTAGAALVWSWFQ